MTTATTTKCCICSAAPFHGNGAQQRELLRTIAARMIGSDDEDDTPRSIDTGDAVDLARAVLAWDSTEVCDDCCPKVERLFDAERLMCPANETPGWFLANGCEIQRDDERNLFQSDGAAADHVAREIRSTGTRHPLGVAVAVIRQHLAAAFPETEALSFEHAIARLLDEHARLTMLVRVRPTQAAPRPLLPLERQIVTAALGLKAEADREKAHTLDATSSMTPALLERWATIAEQLAETVDHAVVLIDEVAP
jgi:hypothetical protein